MTNGSWRYRYVGPTDVRAAALSGDEGQPITSPDEFESWLAAVDARDLDEPFTFVIDIDGVLRLAPRRSEHVACAGGGKVLSAGEIRFARGAAGWAVDEVTNQSTGYCPDVASWPAVAATLDRLGLRHPAGFNPAFIFRRCPSCHERSVVKDDDFVCAVCGTALPLRWNVDSAFHPCV